MLFTNSPPLSRWMLLGALDSTPPSTTLFMLASINHPQHPPKHHSQYPCMNKLDWPDVRQFQLLQEDRIVNKYKQWISSLITLTMIVVLYIICNIPCLFEHLNLCGCKKQPKWLLILIYVSHFLLTLNSSANFVIYYSTEWHFKRYLNNCLNKVKCIDGHIRFAHPN